MMQSRLHDITILKRGVSKTYAATCSCGWSVQVRDKPTALIDAAAHMKSVILWHGLELVAVLMSVSTTLPMKPNE